MPDFSDEALFHQMPVLNTEYRFSAGINNFLSASDGSFAAAYGKYYEDASPDKIKYRAPVVGPHRIRDEAAEKRYFRSAVEAERSALFRKLEMFTLDWLKDKKPILRFPSSKRCFFQNSQDEESFEFDYFAELEQGSYFTDRLTTIRQGAARLQTYLTRTKSKPFSCYAGGDPNAPLRRQLIKGAVLLLIAVLFFVHFALLFHAAKAGLRGEALVESLRAVPLLQFLFRAVSLSVTNPEGWSFVLLVAGICFGAYGLQFVLTAKKLTEENKTRFHQLLADLNGALAETEAACLEVYRYARFCQLWYEAEERKPPLMLEQAKQSASAALDPCRRCRESMPKAAASQG